MGLRPPGHVLGGLRGQPFFPRPCGRGVGRLFQLGHWPTGSCCRLLSSGVVMARMLVDPGARAVGRPLMVGQSTQCRGPRGTSPGIGLIISRDVCRQRQGTCIQSVLPKQGSGEHGKGGATRWSRLFYGAPMACTPSCFGIATALTMDILTAARKLGQAEMARLSRATAPAGPDYLFVGKESPAQSVGPNGDSKTLCSHSPWPSVIYACPVAPARSGKQDDDLPWHTRWRNNLGWHGPPPAGTLDPRHAWGVRLLPRRRPETLIRSALK